MPLVIFNYNAAGSTELIDHKVTQIVLPADAPRNSRWFLRSIQAVYFSNSNDDFRTFEINIPALFTNDRIRFSSGAEGVSTTPPENNLRFFVNNLSSGGTREDCAFKSVSLTPNLNLGRHTLDSRLFSIVVTARRGGGTRDVVKLAGYSVVFEYE